MLGVLSLMSGGGFILASYYLQEPMRSELLAWIAFLINALVFSIFVSSERMPMGKYIETEKASEIFQAMNASLLRYKRECDKAHAALVFVSRSLKPGDIVGTAFLRELTDMLKKTENGKG